MLIDTHAHVYAEQFKEDFEQVEQNALNNDVNQILLPNIDLESIQGVRSLMARNPAIYKGMMGLHPCSVGADYQDVLVQIKNELDAADYIAVGEIGIDLYWDQSFLNQQIEAFKIQIEWAKEKQLPIAIHARDSFNEIFEVLDEVNDESLCGVFHCFTGNREQAERVLNYGGFKLGIGGVFTFKNSKLRTELAGIDLKHIVFETDAPYLAPAPFRGKRNEPAYTKLVAEAWAKNFDISLEELARITSANAKELFKLA